MEFQHLAPSLDRAVSLSRQVMSQGMRVFGGWGYREIQVPLLHFFDSLRPGMDEMQVERSFRFVDRGGNLMVLRPDVTVVIAKIYAYQLQDVALPFRVSYANKVVRLQRSFTQDQLESYQLGVEHIGGEEHLADIEVLLVALEVLDRLKLPNGRVALADYQVAKHLLRATGAPRRLRDEVRDSVVARDADEVTRRLNKIGIRSHFIDAIAALTWLDGGPDQLKEIGRLLPDDVKLHSRLAYLRSVYEMLSAVGCGDRVRFEMGEIGGAPYYSGIGFSLMCDGATREIGRGGRYDDLMSRFGAQVPAVGFSMSLESIVEVLHPGHGEMTPHRSEEHVVDVGEDDLLRGLREVLDLRQRNIPTRIQKRASKHPRGTLSLGDAESS